MANEEYIMTKKRAKFNLIWNSLISKLPKSSQKPLVKNGYAFNSQLFNHKEQYIVCRRTLVKSTSKIYMNKSDLERIFVDYESYIDEIKKYQLDARERIDNGLEVFQTDIDQLKKKFSKEIASLKSEKRYAETLIRIGGGSLKSEAEISKLTLHKIGDYVRAKRIKKKFSCIYFEFKEYGIDKVLQVIWRKHNVQDVLIEQKVSRFVEFCKQHNIVDIYDLMLIPYYCRNLVNEFGADCLQAVINSIKTFIELQTFEFANISFSDLE